MRRPRRQVDPTVTRLNASRRAREIDLRSLAGFQQRPRCGFEPSLNQPRQDDRSGHDKGGALFVLVWFPDNRWFAIIVLVVVWLSRHRVAIRRRSSAAATLCRIALEEMTKRI
jgi:hypothetical protein